MGSQLTPYGFIEFVHCWELRRTQRGDHQKLFCISLGILGEYKLVFELKLVANYSEKTGYKIMCHLTWVLKVARVVAQSLAVDVHKKLYKLTLISIPKKKTIYNCLQNEQTGKFFTYISMVISNKEWFHSFLNPVFAQRHCNTSIKMYLYYHESKIWMVWLLSWQILNLLLVDFVFHGFYVLGTIQPIFRFIIPSMNAYFDFNLTISYTHRSVVPIIKTHDLINL